MKNKYLSSLEAIGALIFPLSAGTKIPIKNSNGFYDAKKNYNLDHLNIGVRLGSGLCVIDFDPRAYTEESRQFVKDLEKHFPFTLKVNTVSDNGFHLYYTYDPKRELKYFDLYPGIQVLAEGRYVVGPGSYHSSTTRFYEPDPVGSFNANDIEILPDFVFEEYENFRTNQNLINREKSLDIIGNDKDVDLSEIKIALEHISSDCDYMIWTKIGMALKSINDDLFDTFESWSRKSEKFKEGECLKKWSSFKNEGVTYRYIFHQANRENPKWVNELPEIDWIEDFIRNENEKSKSFFTEPSPKIINPFTKTRSNPDTLPEFPPGARNFKELVYSIYNSAPNKMPYFSIATALAKISYVSAKKLKGITGSNLNLFQIIHIKSGGGKAHYTDCAIEDSFSQTPGSGAGIFDSLKLNNNQIFVSPEIGKFLSQLSPSKKHVQGDTIIDTLLQAYDGKPITAQATKSNLKVAQLKGEDLSPIEDYQYSIFGASTSEIIERFILDDDLRNSGLTNRFIYYSDTGYDPIDMPKEFGSKVIYPDKFFDFIEAMSEVDSKIELRGDYEWINATLFKEDQKLQALVINDQVKSNMRMRTFQNAMRIASLIIGYENTINQRWSHSPDKEILRWAWQLSLKSTMDSFKLIDNHRKNEKTDFEQIFYEELESKCHPKGINTPLKKSVLYKNRTKKDAKKRQIEKKFIELGIIKLTNDNKSIQWIET